MTDHTPPQNIELEMCVLGGIMLEPARAYQIAADYLTRESFYLDGHGLIFELMGKLHHAGRPPDSDLILDELNKRKLLEKVGGAGTILSMLNAVASAANVEHHAKQIAEKATYRALIRASTQVIEECYRQELPAIEVLSQAENAVIALSRDAFGGQDAVILSQSLAEYWTELWEREKLIKAQVAVGERSIIGVGLPTGYGDLDMMLGGLRKSELIILAARPSMGKTALGLCIARNLAIRHQVPTLLFSLEMGVDQLDERLLSMGTYHLRGERVFGITTHRLKTHRPELHPEERQRLEHVKAELDQAPLYIDDTSVMNTAQLKSKVRRMVSRHGIQCVIVDYLQLMEGQGRDRVQDVTAISRGLKQIAREMKIPVIALSQLSRALKERKASEYRPLLTDLRESGAIEQDADVVIFIHRRDYYEAKPPHRPEWAGTFAADLREAEIIVAKNRNGPTETMHLNWIPELTLFRNRDEV